MDPSASSGHSSRHIGLIGRGVRLLGSRRDGCAGDAQQVALFIAGTASDAGADRSFKCFGGCGEVVIAYGPLPSLACVEPRSQYIRDALSGACEGTIKRPVTHRHILIVYPVFKNHGQNCDAGARIPGTLLPNILRLHQRDTPLTGANAYSASCADSSAASSARLRATRAATSSSART